MFSGEFRYTSNLDLSYLKDTFYSYYKKLDEMDGKDLVMLFGSSKSGKSTFANYMAGCQMENKEKYGGIVIVPKSQLSYVKIGHGMFSETSYPQSIATEYGFEYCDSPSFDDNRLVDAKVCGSILTQLAIQKAKSVKGVVIFIPYHCFQRLDLFYHNIDTINHLFMDLLKADKSVILLITKAPKDIDVNHIISKFKYYSELEEKNGLNKTTARAVYKLILKNPHIINLFRPLDETQRDVILRQIKDFKTISKNQFKFPQCDPDHIKLKEIIIEIANNSSKLFEHRNHIKEILSTNFSEQYNVRYERQLQEIEEDILNSLLEQTSDMQFAYKLAQFIHFDSTAITKFALLYKQFQDDFEKIKKAPFKKTESKHGGNPLISLLSSSSSSLFSLFNQNQEDSKSSQVEINKEEVKYSHE